MGNITFRDLRTGRTTRVLRAHEHGISKLALSRDESLLASSCHEHKICIWTVASGVCAHELRDHSYFVQGLAFTNDNSGLISGGTDGRIILWDTTTGTSRRKWGSRTRVYVVGDNDENRYGADHVGEDNDGPTEYYFVAVL